MCYCAQKVIQWSHCELERDSLTTINVLYVSELGCNRSTLRSELARRHGIFPCLLLSPHRRYYGKPSGSQLHF